MICWLRLCVRCCSALRNDAAFKLTYYYGRMGALAPLQTVGHPESQLAQVASAPAPDIPGPQPPGIGQLRSAFSGIGGGRFPTRTRRKAQKQVSGHMQDCLAACLKAAAVAGLLDGRSVPSFDWTCSHSIDSVGSSLACFSRLCDVLV